MVYGGSFNPVLYSHISIAEQAKNTFKEVEKVIFVPVSSKYEKEGLIEDKYRYEMLKLAINGNDNFLVSDIELKSEKQLHTIQTLKKLKKQYEKYEICFMMGTDNLKELDTWNCPEEILRDFKMVVVERDKDILEDIIQENELLKKYSHNILKLKCNIVENMSSTYVRNKIKLKESIKGLLPENVEKYIEKNKLYL